MNTVLLELKARPDNTVWKALGGGGGGGKGGGCLSFHNPGPDKQLFKVSYCSRRWPSLHHQAAGSLLFSLVSWQLVSTGSHMHAAAGGTGSGSQAAAVLLIKYPNVIMKPLQSHRKATLRCENMSTFHRKMPQNQSAGQQAAKWSHLHETESRCRTAGSAAITTAAAAAFI